MPDAMLTKRALAAAIRQLMTEKPLAKISIADIVERCGMNRQSFYYHFRDKYDLVNWIFYTELISRLQQAPEPSDWQVLQIMCEYLYENRKFYIGALKVTGQNSFYEYFGDVVYQILRATTADMFSDSSQGDFNAVFYADAFRSCIYRWLTTGAKTPPDEFVKYVRNAISDINDVSSRAEQSLFRFVQQGKF